MSQKGITYVLLGSQRPDVGDVVRPMSRLTKMDEGEIRVLLTSHGPRLFQAYQRRSDAQGLANQLRALGLAVAAVGVEEILEYVFVPAVRINIGQGGFSAFGGENEPPVFIPFSDMAAIVQGEVSEMIGQERIMGTRPGESKVRNTYNRMVYVDIHRRSVPVAVRLRKTDFHLNPIVAGEAIDGPTDLTRCVALLREKSPLARFDDGFGRSGHAVAGSLQLLDAGEGAAIAPRSIEDEIPHSPPPLPPGETNPAELLELPAFDLYSTLWRYQAISD
jgi:hypothetical protein